MLLPIIHDRRYQETPNVACCIGYDLAKWRVKKLSKYVLDAIPEFVLTDDEIADIDALSPYSTLEKALPAFTDARNPSSGGEVGELLAHKILSRDFGTKQLVKRLHYKMRSRDAVTGFDIVHYKAVGHSNIELWLGEAKFHKSRMSAVQKTIKSLSDHIDAGILTERKSLIGPKIPRTNPDYDRLQWLFHPDTILDEIVSRMIVPVFIAADTKSDPVGDLPPKYNESVLSELDDIIDKITNGLRSTLKLVFIYVPLNNKDAFDTDFASRLQAFA
jgi:hypothetical protein